MALAAVLLTAAGPLRAQDPAEPESAAPGSPAGDPRESHAAAPDRTTVVFPDRIDVALVNLQIWVTDAAGEPVVALLPEDFALRVDGEPVEITHFSEIRGDRPVPFASPSAGAPSEPGESSELLVAAPLEEESLILYFDELHLSRLQRQPAVEDLQELVASHRVPPERMMILRQAGRLTSEASFGSSAERLDSVLERLKKPPAELAAPAEKRLVVARMWDLWEEARQRAPFGMDPCQFFVGPAQAEIGAWARESAVRTQQTLGQLADVAEFLGGVPGVKTMIYLGDSLELTPGVDLLEIVHGLCPTDLPAAPTPFDTEDLSARFERVAAAANAGRVTIHTLQAGGLSPGTIGSPDQRSSNPQLFARFERALRTGERAGLEVLAQRTGGRAVRDTNRFDDALERIARDLGSYYSLGFTPPEGFVAGMHRVEVSARHRGLKVRHRRELQVKTPAERLDELALRAIYLGTAPEPFGLRLAHGAIRSAEKGRFLLPVHVLVPVDRIEYAPRDDGAPRASLEVAVHARSPDQPEGPAVRRIFRFDRPEETSGRAELVVELPLLPGLHVVGVGVRDQVSGKIAAVATTLGVQPPPDDRE